MSEQDGTAFLVMQYLQGETLADRLAKGNGEFVPLCRTPSHQAAGGVSTVPCALTMTAARSL